VREEPARCGCSATKVTDSIPSSGWLG